MQEKETQHCVQTGYYVQRIEREVGGTVVLASDDIGLELGVGGLGPVEGQIEERDVQPGEPGVEPAVGKVGVAAEYEVDVGCHRSHRVLRGEPALLDDRNGRSLGVAVDHQVLVLITRHRGLEVSHPRLNRLIDRAVEEPRQLPPRLIRPPCTTRSPDPLVTDRGPEKPEHSRDRPVLLGRRDRDVVHVLTGMRGCEVLGADGLHPVLIGGGTRAAAQDQGRRVSCLRDSRVRRDRRSSEPEHERKHSDPSDAHGNSHRHPPFGSTGSARTSSIRDEPTTSVPDHRNPAVGCGNHLSAAEPSGFTASRGRRRGRRRQRCVGRGQESRRP